MAEKCKHLHIIEWDCGCSLSASCNTCQCDYICTDCNEPLQHSHPAVTIWAAQSTGRTEALAELTMPLIDRETKIALCILSVITIAMFVAAAFFR